MVWKTFSCNIPSTTTGKPVYNKETSKSNTDNLTNPKPCLSGPVVSTTEGFGPKHSESWRTCVNNPMELVNLLTTAGGSSNSSPISAIILLKISTPSLIASPFSGFAFMYSSTLSVITSLFNMSFTNAECLYDWQVSKIFTNKCAEFS